MKINLEEKLKHLPDKPGVYIMKDERSEVIYVGKAVSLKNRVRSYFHKGQAHLPKVQLMVSKVEDIDWLITNNEVEALMLECNLIKRHRPHYNVRLRDDKHYPYLCVTTSEPFPRIIVVRRSKKDGNKYYGPYADTSAMRESLRLIRRVFRIRGCNKKLTGTENDRPCLNLHIGQCEAPCARQITQEEYMSKVSDASLFLEGRQESIAKRLEKDMSSAAENLEFERAARMRDQIMSIRKLVERQKVISTKAIDQDVLSTIVKGSTSCVEILFVRSGKLVGKDHFFLDGITDDTAEFGLSEFIKQYYRDVTYIPKEILVSHEPTEHSILEEWLSEKQGSRVKIMHPKRGEKLQLVEIGLENAIQAVDQENHRKLEDTENSSKDLEALLEVLKLDKIPARIEAYDISNIQGREAVGSMVVFHDGVPANSQYRRFKIRLPEQPDDYGMMREVLRRRFANAASDNSKFSHLPDLILIDGGKGHLNAAVSALADTDYKIQLISLAKKFEEIYTHNSSNPLILPKDSRALRLLQRIRDEAHRFAISYHRKLREKAANKSVLDSIPGIGGQRRKALVRKFGSVAGVRRASVEELLMVPGITRPVAQTVYDTLHSE